MNILPPKIQTLLTKLNTPNRLNNHLQIVYKTANQLLTALENNWQNLELDKEAILFGAANHDIGKVIVTAELYDKGKRHEKVGYELLIENGYTEQLARFAKTHSDWNNDFVEIDDLIVSLSDKIWKGKRIHDLEEKLCLKIAEQLTLDFWEVYQTLDEILSKMVLSADKNLNYQKA